jgi:hypothetical protein
MVPDTFGWTSLLPTAPHRAVFYLLSDAGSAENASMPKILIEHETRYRAYIQKHGVGDNDLVASSPNSYVSYLRSVSRLLGVPIAPELLHCEDGVESIASRLQGNRAKNTINNYKSAMRQYVAMVHHDGLFRTHS